MALLIGLFFVRPPLPKGVITLSFTFTIDDPAVGQFSWTPPQPLQERYLSFPPDLQLEIATEVRQAVALHLRGIAGIITSGETAKCLFEILNGALLEATMKVLDVMRQVVSGELPPCGHANCARPGN